MKHLVIYYLLLLAISATANSDISRGFEPRPQYPVRQSFKCTDEKNNALLAQEVVNRKKEPLLILQLGGQDYSGEVIYTDNMYTIQLVSSYHQTYSIYIKSEDATYFCVSISKPVYN